MEVEDDNDDDGSDDEDDDVHGQINTEQAKANVKVKLLSLIQVKWGSGKEFLFNTGNTCKLGMDLRQEKPVLSFRMVWFELELLSAEFKWHLISQYIV